MTTIRQRDLHGLKGNGRPRPCDRLSTLRPFYFMMSDPLDRLRYLRHGLAAVLLFTGATMIGSEWVHISPGVSVGIIGLVLRETIAVSKWPRRIRETVPLEGEKKRRKGVAEEQWTPKTASCIPIRLSKPPRWDGCHE